MIGAYTGARIEEICQLKTGDILTSDGVECFYIRDGKTENAERIVPIHKDLKSVVKRLIKDSEDQYLISVSGKNKYGNRSDSLGKQFGRLKKSIGYGPEFVFHSMRKSFITLLQNNDIPGLTIASIVGHETGTITFDVYSAGPSARQKLKAISTLKVIHQ
ncbi:phage integrase family protein [Alcanivorax sp. 521-1]|uniref:Phage integrase family protein n=2 Tax=Alloalcanivorax profundimaris TaxID=2735259 RepID=A0ABS0AQG7_9GAMM|nr:phage integrase family protein [Alloalcanivorax profundimaris]